MPANEAPGPGVSKAISDQPVVSRFAAQFAQPELITTTTQKMRTPKGLLRIGVPVENQEKHGRNPPGGKSTGLGKGASSFGFNSILEFRYYAEFMLCSNTF